MSKDGKVTFNLVIDGVDPAVADQIVTSMIESIQDLRAQTGLKPRLEWEEEPAANHVITASLAPKPVKVRLGRQAQQPQGSGNTAAHAAVPPPAGQQPQGSQPRGSQPPVTPPTPPPANQGQGPEQPQQPDPNAGQAAEAAPPPAKSFFSRERAPAPDPNQGGTGN